MYIPSNIKIFTHFQTRCLQVESERTKRSTFHIAESFALENERFEISLASSTNKLQFRYIVSIIFDPLLKDLEFLQSYIYNCLISLSNIIGTLLQAIE